ncbi:hypothetical protein [Nocardia sp. NPDC051570]|uniref:hypothetical protein n=1 Tax=Nocardia sp. NPDC051570 TaxID=3364324 RepID=UPI0037AF0F61
MPADASRFSVFAPVDEVIEEAAELCWSIWDGLSVQANLGTGREDLLAAARLARELICRQTTAADRSARIFPMGYFSSSITAPNFSRSGSSTVKYVIP